MIRKKNTRNARYVRVIHQMLVNSPVRMVPPDVMMSAENTMMSALVCRFASCLQCNLLLLMQSLHSDSGLCVQMPYGFWFMVFFLGV